jgi:hypothetical protein
LINYFYKIAKLGCIKNLSVYSDVVYEIRFFLYGKNEAGEEAYELAVCHLETSKFTSLSDESWTCKNFIPYNELTETIICKWIEEALGEHQIDLYKKKIEDKLQPPTYYKDLPFKVMT